MNEERLWAPWRLEYVSGTESSHLEIPQPARWFPGADESCFLCRDAAEFCESVRESADKKLLVVARAQHSITVLNRYPYNNGHLLVAPRRHVGDLAAMNHDEHLECIEQLARLTTVYRNCLNTEGFNIGLNLGRVAGAGLPGHLHWHLVPRWAGDNNFMPVLAGTRVIPQSLEALWELLIGALHEMDCGAAKSADN